MTNLRKKLLLAGLSAGLALLPLAGCTTGGTTESGSKGGSLESEKNATLSIMIPGHNPNSTEESAWQNPVVEEFRSLYPDVEVEFVNAGWDTWYERTMSAYQSGDPIDLINDGANNNPRFALKGITQPLESYINLDNPNLHKNTMDAVFKYGGHYYVAVSETNVAVIFYNKDIFEDEGMDDPLALYEKGEWNWDNFSRIAAALTDKEENRWGYASDYPYLFFGMNATSMLTLDDNSRYQLNIDAPALRQSLEMLQDGVYTSKWCGYDSDPWTTFYRGNAAMLGDFQWVDAQILAARDYGLADFEYGVAPMPTGPNNTEGVSPITAAGWAIGNGSDCPAHTGKLIDMLVDGQAAYIAKTNESLDPAHVELYQTLAQKPFCTNSYDSAVGGAYEICAAVGEGQSISQAIEKYKPEYQRKVDEANSSNLDTEFNPTGGETTGSDTDTTWIPNTDAGTDTTTSAE
ncbi:MAG TPA: extracellular solute-binding protein [Firmicutes bacterium]|nr:extracellular solute-binding protein [Bacillota bacterium]